MTCVGNRKSEQIPETSGSCPQHCGGSSEQSSGGGGEAKDSTEQDKADEQGKEVAVNVDKNIILL